jgi:hypothetical protein
VVFADAEDIEPGLVGEDREIDELAQATRGSIGRLVSGSMAISPNVNNPISNGRVAVMASPPVEPVRSGRRATDAAVRRPRC